MPMDDPLDDGQSDARPLVIVGGVESLKCLKKFVSVGHIKTRTVVPDEESPFPIGAIHLTHFDFGVLPPGGELT